MVILINMGSMVTHLPPLFKGCLLDPPPFLQMMQKHQLWISGPVYLDENTRHQYSEFVKKLEGLKNITYPVCLNENNKHHFDVISKHLDTLKQMNGPIYINENTKHSFNIIQKAAEGIKNVTYPVLQDDSFKHHFNQVEKHAEALKNMAGLCPQVPMKSNQMHTSFGFFEL